MSPSSRPPLAAALAAGAWLAALAAPPGGRAAALLLPFAAVVPAALRLAARRLGTAAAPWTPWLAAAAAATLVGGLGGGPGRALAAVPILVAAACGAALRPAPAAGVAAALVVGELVSGLRLGAGVGPLSAQLLAVAGAAAAPAFLLSRLREDRDELRSRMAALTGAGSASTAPVGPEPPQTGRAPAEPARGRELEGLLELTRRAMRARSCVLYERVLDPPSWRVAAGASEAADFDGLATAPLGHGLVAWAARHEMPFRISEPGPQLRSVPHYSGDSETGSFLAVPLSLTPPASARADETGAWAVLVVDSAHPRRFEEGGEELLALHAAELSERLELRLRLARWRHDRAAVAELPSAVLRLGEGGGLSAVAGRLMEEALRLSGASAGAVLWHDARAADGSLPASTERGRGPVLLAAEGLDLEGGQRLEAADESWMTWSAAHPGQSVVLAAFHADRGMPRIARGDGLDASWSFVAEALAPAGALAVAWPERHLPGAAVLEAVRVLAGAGAAALLREEALARLADRRRLDGLTGLAGRTEFLREAPRAVARAVQGDGRLGLLLFDVDRSGRLLKEAGPDAWDEAIEACARALTAALPAAAELFRWGGDEFAALLPGAGDEGVTVAARRACSAAGQVQTAGRALTVGAGTACLRPDREDFAGLFARAASALSLARQVGNGKVVAAQEPER